MRRLYSVAQADFRQRIRSRRLLVVFAVVAYLGYLVNVGQIELAYQMGDGDAVTSVHGVGTAAFVGLKAGLTGSMILLFAGFYLMKNALERDRRNDVDRLVASTPVSDRTYLLGKWASNVALGTAILGVLGVATVVNHAVHGVGPTKPVALVGPLFAFGVPLSAVVGGVALLFETVNRLDGTLGNVVYFFLIPFAVVGMASADGLRPSEIPLVVRAGDAIGALAVYELTGEVLLAQVPEYGGGPPSFGVLQGDEQSFRYDGGAWPLWIYVQRVGLLVPALALVLASTIPFERLRPAGDSEAAGTLSEVVESVSALGEADEAAAVDGGTVDATSLTPVTERNTGGFVRLVAAELRLALRGHRWWWYAGAVGLVAVPVASLAVPTVPSLLTEPFDQMILPLAFVWPIFVWSSLGVRTVEHRLTDLVFSSTYPVRQLVAEWVAGVVVAFGVSAGVLALFVEVGLGTGALVGYAAGVLFAPSLAVAAGAWSRSSWPFEVTYLLLWYAGPVNGAAKVDFLGLTADSVRMGVPAAFVGLSLALFVAAVARRKLSVN